MPDDQDRAEEFDDDALDVEALELEADDQDRLDGKPEGDRIQLIDQATDSGVDDEPQAVADYVEGDRSEMSAEEAAVHLVQDNDA